MATKKTAAPEATTPATANAATAPEAPKEAGKIQKIILLSRAGYPNKEIIGMGYNKSTVAIQTAARKKDPAGYDQKHGIDVASSMFTVPKYVAPAPAEAAPTAPVAGTKAVEI